MNASVGARMVRPAVQVVRRTLGWGQSWARWWWVMTLLAVGAIALNTVVWTWADCRYLDEMQMAQYRARPDDYGAPPEPVRPPLITPVMRIAGRVVSAASGWIGWAIGLFLVGLLLGLDDLGFATGLKIALWSWLPYVVCALAQCLYMGLTGDPIYNPGLSGLVLDQTPPPPGGGYVYVMPTQGQLLSSELLARVDLYLFWRLALVAAGVRRQADQAWWKGLLIALGVGGMLLAIALLPAFFPGAFTRFRFF
ncbi:MAG: hypothetical protein JXA09_08600 [Anaerolineae bacterium]|nr:hypothetical protein [Anaerolineae bacterium]